VADKQAQSAGEGEVNQFQAQGDIVIYQSQGVDLSAVSQIIDARADALRREFTEHAAALVDQRLADFGTKVMDEVKQQPAMLPSFADPDFQFDILAAQESAARSGSDDDYDLLVDLLAQRATSEPTPRVKLGTRRALRVVGELPHEAVNALSVMLYGLRLHAEARTLEQALGHTNAHLGNFVDHLPDSTTWLVDLAVTDCITLSTGGLSKLKTFGQLLAQNNPGFTCVGFGPEAAAEWRERLDEACPELGALVVEHPLVDDGFCLVGGDSDELRKAAAQIAGSHGRSVDECLPVVEMAIEQNRYAERAPDVEERLREKAISYPALARLYEWWGTEFPVITFTAVGIVIAYANLRRTLKDVGIVPIEKLL
jgi:hypothetical protein